MVTKKSLSSYWLRGLGRLHGMYSNPEMRSSPEYLMQLTQVRRGIASFVRIMTGQDIPVRFSTGEHSYQARTKTGEKYIVISATDDPDKFDSNVGIALHEAGHIILSNPSRLPESVPYFDFLSFLYDTDIRELIPKETLESAAQLGLSDEEVRAWVDMMMNFLEDRRIDRWVYSHVRGYRGYYDALYSEYWLNPNIGKMLQNPLTHEPTLQSYKLHIINMINAAADPSFLPGLDEIWGLIDLPNLDRFNHDPNWDTYQESRSESFRRVITKSGAKRLVSNGFFAYPLESMPKMVEVAIRVLGVVFSNAVAEPHRPPDSGDGQESSESNKKKVVQTGGQNNNDFEGQNLDIPDRTDSASENEVQKVVQDIIDQQEKFLQGDIVTQTITRAQEDGMSALESSGAELKVIDIKDGGRARVVVYNRLTYQLISSTTFKFSSVKGGIPVKDDSMTAVIRRGEVIGNMLAGRLQVMADESPLTYTRQKLGKIDNRTLAELGFGEVNVFERTLVERYAPVQLHLTVDASGSMSGSKWYNSMTLAVALAVAAGKLSTLDVVISIRGSDTDVARVAIIYDSKKDSVAKIKTLFPYLRAAGGTPEGICFAAIKDQILSMGGRTTRKFLVNISDGEPWMWWFDGNTKYEYKGEAAWHHTATQVMEFRNNGIDVLSYFVTDSPQFASMNPNDPTLKEWQKRAVETVTSAQRAFQIMYGRSAQTIDPTSVTQIARTLNSMFLQKC